MNDDTLRALADRQQITGLIYRYCRAVDRLDIALGHSIWHDDGIADYGADVYQGRGRGVIDHICAQHRHTLMHSHKISHVILELDGTRTGSQSYVPSPLPVRRAGKLTPLSVWSRYDDHMPRRTGRWCLAPLLATRHSEQLLAVP